MSWSNELRVYKRHTKHTIYRYARTTTTTIELCILKDFFSLLFDRQSRCLFLAVARLRLERNLPRFILIFFFSLSLCVLFANSSVCRVHIFLDVVDGNFSQYYFLCVVSCLACFWLTIMSEVQFFFSRKKIDITFLSVSVLMCTDLSTLYSIFSRFAFIVSFFLLSPFVEFCKLSKLVRAAAQFARINLLFLYRFFMVKIGCKN